MFSGLFSLPFAPAASADLVVREPGRPAFDSFLAGCENAVVKSLAAAVIKRDLPFNPIVLYGASGSGKSSLAAGLAALRRQQYGLHEVIETTGIELGRALTNAVETASVADLRARHHRCEILLVDDVHRLAGKPAVQEFLLASIDALVHRGSLVIVTLRQPPTATARLSPQLVSRLMGGCVVGLALPGPLARRELVRQTADRLRLTLTDDEISQLAHCDGARRDPFVTASRLGSSVLRRAVAGESGGRPIKPRSRQSDSPEIKAVCRQAAVAVGKHFGLTLGELKSKSRRQAVADARGLAIYVARQLTGASYAELGRQFGNRDHTTVLHAFQKLAAAVDRDRSMRQLAEELAAQIVGEGAN